MPRALSSPVMKSAVERVSPGGLGLRQRTKALRKATSVSRSSSIQTFSCSRSLVAMFRLLCLGGLCLGGLSRRWLVGVSGLLVGRSLQELRQAEEQDRYQDQQRRDGRDRRIDLVAQRVEHAPRQGRLVAARDAKTNTDR